MKIINYVVMHIVCWIDNVIIKFKELETKKKVLIICVCTMSLVFLIILMNPLRRSEEHIRERMLKLTPVGTSIEDVVEIINKRGWSNDGVLDRGYGLANGGTPTIYTSYFTNEPVIGTKSIRANIGEYHAYMIIYTWVFCYWGFDENSRLIDIAIEKECDVI